MPRLAFVLFKYFPFGGLQRDFLGIATEALARGFVVDVYTMSWEGEKPAGINVIIIPSQGMSNHQRYCHFVNVFSQHRENKTYQAVIGFNKIPNLDFYYAADPCFLAKYQTWQRYIPRYRYFAQFEANVFSRASQTEILALSHKQIEQFQANYLTPSQRFHLLPPWLNISHYQGHDRDLCRQQFAQELHLNTQHKWMLHVGSGFRTKGLDRSLKAFAALPSELASVTEFIIIGQDNPRTFKRLAATLNISHRVHFIGGRSDVPQWMAAADVLLHPAYAENTGNVLLEAIASGLPVLTTAVCGYAAHVMQAKAGIVLDEPFAKHALTHHLANMLSSDFRSSSEMIHYLASLDLASMPKRVLTLIEAKITRSDQTMLLRTKKITQEGWLLSEIADKYPQLLKAEKQEIQFDWSAIFDLQGQVARKIAERETLCIDMKHDNDPCRYYIKRFLPTSYYQALKSRLLKRDDIGVLPEYNAVNRLQALQVPTLDIAGFGVEHKINPRSFMMTHALPGISLEDYCKDWLMRKPSREMKLAVITQLAVTLRIMHHHGMNHRDCYLCHFWIEPNKKLQRGSIDNLNLWVMDLHRSQYYARIPARWKIKDLSALLYSGWQIALTSRDLCRFIEAYVGMPWRKHYMDNIRFWKKTLQKTLRLRQREYRLNLKTPSNDWLRDILKRMKAVQS